MSEIGWTILLRFINARFRIGRIFGVLFTINYSLALVPIAVAVYCWPDFRLFCGLMSFCIGIAASLLFHEICHALAGHYVGRNVREIGLLPIGGFTLFTQFPSGSWADLVVSLAGPLGNGFICVGLIVLEIGLLDGSINERFVHVVELLYDDDITMDNITFLTVWSNAVLRINLLLLVVNLMPAFPLDGGRCLRILLVHFMPQHQAVASSVVISRIIAVGIVVYAITDALIGPGCVMDIPIAFLMFLLIWCMSGMKPMRTRHSTEIGSLGSCDDSPTENEAVLTIPTECVAPAQ